MFKKVEFNDLIRGDRVFVQPTGCDTVKSINQNGFIGYIYDSTIKPDNENIGVIYVDIRWRSRRKEMPSMWLDTVPLIQDLCEVRFHNDEYFVTDLSLAKAKVAYQRNKKRTTL